MGEQKNQTESESDASLASATGVREVALTDGELAQYKSDAQIMKAHWASQAKVTVSIPPDSFIGKEARVNSGGWVPITVNGFTAYVRADGQEQDVPQGVAEIIQQSLEAEAYARDNEQRLAKRGVIGQV